MSEEFETVIRVPKPGAGPRTDYTSMDKFDQFAHQDANSMRETLRNISPGPWTLGGYKVFSGVATPGFRPKPLLRLMEGGNPADLVFAQRARQDIPHMLNMLAQLAVENEKLRSLCGQSAELLMKQKTSAWRKAWDWFLTH